MSIGGFMGIGDKYFAIPLDVYSFEYDYGKDYAVLNVSKDKLENAPGFDKDNWPQHADYTFIDSVHTLTDTSSIRKGIHQKHINMQLE